MNEFCEITMPDFIYKMRGDKLEKYYKCWNCNHTGFWDECETTPDGCMICAPEW